MTNDGNDPFGDFIKKWQKRAEQIVSFLSWILHLFLILSISALLFYYHITKIQEDLIKDYPVFVESKDK